MTRREPAGPRRTHGRIAPVMGLAMGAMIPAAAHGPVAGAGAAIVALHAVAALAAATLALVVPRARRAAARHRPTPRATGRMGAGMAVGFAAVCAHCLATWHGSA